MYSSDQYHNEQKTKSQHSQRSREFGELSQAKQYYQRQKVATPQTSVNTIKSHHISGSDPERREGQVMAHHSILPSQDLHSAALDNNTELLSVLLAVPGVDVNLQDNLGRTPLMVA